MRRRYYRRKKSIATKEQPFFKENTPLIQTKEEKRPFFKSKENDGLTIGQPGDKYEVEADAMADAVMNNSSSTTAIQAMEISGIQKMEEEVAVQAKIHRQALEEESLQMKSEEEEIQMKSEEEEISVQTKTNGTPRANTKLSNRIKQSTGGGQALAPKTKQKMEGAFGVDFSNVSIHTNSEAVQMNQELNAHAFTHGNDVYFNNGKYQPETSAGQHLLAHELTHVVQQSKNRDKLQPSLQLFRISNGGFGRTLEDFTDANNVPQRTIRRLLTSPEFMRIVRGLDRNYVARSRSYSFNPTYDANERITGGDRGMPRSYIGKRELYITEDSSGASFQSFESPDNALSADVLLVQHTRGANFIQDLVHEACHAFNHVAGNAPTPANLVGAIRAGIQEEISVRNMEDQITGQIHRRNPNLNFRDVGSTVPAEVARDFAPGIGLTYLENFFFSYRLREMQIQDGFTDEQAKRMRDSVNANQSLVFKPEVDPQLGIYVLSEYGMTWRDRLRAKRSWTEFNNQGNTSDAAKESKLQEHANLFFRGLVRYTSLP